MYLAALRLTAQYKYNTVRRSALLLQARQRYYMKKPNPLCLSLCLSTSHCTIQVPLSALLLQARQAPACVLVRFVVGCGPCATHLYTHTHTHTHTS